MSESNETKMGRKPIQIDFDELNRLCEMQCTLIEIAGWFECSVDTIERRIKEHFGLTFAEYFSTKSAKGKISLRRKQFQVAIGGNTRMLTWLGANYLGQSHKTELSSNEDKPFKLSYSFNKKDEGENSNEDT